ncbi:MAG: hypothetical protein HYT37_02270 [Candidatus Sungbacteria bacterium]|nr:hypothetical protein [Candidatus Sungbacteria bacterium]
MIRVGIDCGTTLIKFVWRDDRQGGYNFATSGSDRELKAVIKKLQGLGVTQANSLGIGSHPCLDAFELIRMRGNPIALELYVQALGAKRLLTLYNKKFSASEFVLVSIGTGTSYVVLGANGFQNYPFGRPLGGGFIIGLGMALGIGATFTEIEKRAVGKPLDILIHDLVSEVDPSDPNFIVTNFGKAKKSSTREDLAATLFHCVASNVVQDVAMIQHFVGVPRHIVYIGTTVALSPTLQKYLKYYSIKLGFAPVFIGKYGGYAGAVGVLHMNDI